MDVFPPTVGFAAEKLLEDAGCTVEVPVAQTCGQPAYNSGDRADAFDLARQVIAAFEDFDYVVVPSGSCGGTIKRHYPHLFDGDPAWQARAERLSAKTFELVSFLTDVLGVERVIARYPDTVTYHDSCSGLRGIGHQIATAPLAGHGRGSRLTGNGRARCAAASAAPSASNIRIVQSHGQRKKPLTSRASEAGTLLAGDLVCLLNMTRQTTTRVRRSRFVTLPKYWPG